MSTVLSHDTLIPRSQQLPFVLARHSSQDCYFDIKLVQIESTTFHRKPAHQLSFKVDLARPFDVAKRIRSACVSVKIGRRSGSQVPPKILGITPEASLVHIADHETSHGQTIGVTAGTPPTAPGSVSLSGNLSWGDKTTFKGERLIHGYLLADNEAHWKLYEEPRSKSGLPPSLSLLVVVGSDASFQVSANMSTARWSGWGPIGTVRSISTPVLEEARVQYIVQSGPVDYVGERAIKVSDDITTMLRESQERMQILEGIVDELFPTLRKGYEVRVQYAAVLKLECRHARTGSHSFGWKQLNVPRFPETLQVGRQMAKSRVDRTNGLFDSSLVSRNHAELWADEVGKVWIKDVKSSQGTFVNGERLSAENQASEPRELRAGDRLEFGQNESREIDGASVTEHNISASIAYVGFPTRRDDLSLDMIAPATKEDQENRAIAMASAEEVQQEVTAKFKTWEAGILEEHNLVLLDKLREIADTRIESRLDALCAEQIGRLSDYLDRRRTHSRGREYLPVGPRMHTSMREAYVTAAEKRKESVGDIDGGVDHLLFGRVTAEQALKNHRTVGGGWSEAKL